MKNWISLFGIGSILSLTVPAFGASAITEVYCPKIITCTNQRCTPVPPKFSQWNTPALPNGQYYFWQAADQAEDQTCFYRDDPHPNTPQIELRATRYRADVYIPNKWDLYNSMYWCVTDDPQNCPFYDPTNAR